MQVIVKTQKKFFEFAFSSSLFLLIHKARWMELLVGIYAFPLIFVCLESLIPRQWPRHSHQGKCSPSRCGCLDDMPTISLHDPDGNEAIVVGPSELKTTRASILLRRRRLRS